MRRVFMLLFATMILSVSAVAQELNQDSLYYNNLYNLDLISQKDVIERLAQPSYDNATVSINSDSFIELSSLDVDKEVEGFRVRIFFDNKQGSRSDAGDAIKAFNSIYPYMNTYLEYEPPYFKVTAGDFITHVEAVAIWGKLLPHFPTAFIVKENIPYGVLLTQ
ncbi:MAG: hypothetical protein R3Y04_07930, partial [Rikenellaceae bacterium]